MYRPGLNRISTGLMIVWTAALPGTTVAHGQHANHAAAVSS